MEVQFRNSFAKDLRDIDNKSLLSRIKEVIETVEAAPTQQDIPDIKKLKGESIYYRIRVGEYRIGVTIEKDIVTFIRCLHRKEIYRYFP